MESGNNGNQESNEEFLLTVHKNLFFGNQKASENKDALLINKINHVLLIGTELGALFKQNFEYMHLNSEDSETENILDHFDRVFEFIEKGSSDNNAILIASPVGRSRGPSILIAYLIKKFNLSFDEAFDRIKAIKDDIKPNDGFLIKLKGYDKKINHKIEYQYKCSLCRKTLFDDSYLEFEHEFTPKDRYSYKRFKKSFVNSDECASYFLSKFETVDPCSLTGERISCPTKNCKNKLGEFFPKGTQCSCGSWVVPAIQIIKSKVDKQPINQKQLFEEHMKPKN